MAKQAKASAGQKRRVGPPEATRQHLRSAREELLAAFQALFPPEFFSRKRAAKREFLMAARTMIDHALERSEAGEQI